MLTRSDDDNRDWADQPAGADIYGRIAAERRALLARALGDARALATSGSVQARCIECLAFAPAAAERFKLGFGIGQLRADRSALTDEIVPLIQQRLWNGDIARA